MFVYQTGKSATKCCEKNSLSLYKRYVYCCLTKTLIFVERQLQRTPWESILNRINGGSFSIFTFERSTSLHKEAHLNRYNFMMLVHRILKMISSILQSYKIIRSCFRDHYFNEVYSKLVFHFVLEMLSISLYVIHILTF